MDFFENHGVALKTERGNRVFPQSDKAADIIDALFLWVKKAGVTIVHTTADELLIEDGVLTGVRAGHKTYKADRIIVATGGASYPQTGSRSRRDTRLCPQIRRSCRWSRTATPVKS